MSLSVQKLGAENEFDLAIIPRFFSTSVYLLLPQFCVRFFRVCLHYKYIACCEEKEKK